MPYSNETNKILISMYHGSVVMLDNFDVYTQNNLFKDGYIVRTPQYGDRRVYLSDAGKAYVESLLASKADKKTENFRFWLPFIISLIALIKSFMPEITAISRAIMELLSQSPAK